MKKSQGKLPTLDLHGFLTDEVFDAVEAFLARESDRGSVKVRIMPGKGSGKVKAVVLDYLKKARYPWEFEKLPNGQRNEGVIIVFMD